MKRTAHHLSSERKKSIVNAALRCFTELGYNETTMPDICERAKASNGSVYYHFKSKEQLAAAVYFEGISAYQAGLLKNLEREAEAFSGIRAIIRFHLTWVVRNPDWARYLFQKRHSSFLNGTDQKFNILNKTFIQRISKWLALHVRQGSIGEMPWDIMVAILLGPCQEFSRLYLSGKAHSKIEKAVSHLSSAAWISLTVAQSVPNNRGKQGSN